MSGASLRYVRIRTIVMVPPTGRDPRLRYGGDRRFRAVRRGRSIERPRASRVIAPPTRRGRAPCALAGLLLHDGGRRTTPGDAPAVGAPRLARVRSARVRVGPVLQRPRPTGPPSRIWHAHVLPKESSSSWCSTNIPPEQASKVLGPSPPQASAHHHNQCSSVFKLRDTIGTGKLHPGLWRGQPEGRTLHGWRAEGGEGEAVSAKLALGVRREEHGAAPRPCASSCTTDHPRWLDGAATGPSAIAHDTRAA